MGENTQIRESRCTGSGDTEILNLPTYSPGLYVVGSRRYVPLLTWQNEMTSQFFAKRNWPKSTELCMSRVSTFNVSHIWEVSQLPNISEHHYEQERLSSFCCIAATHSRLEGKILGLIIILSYHKIESIHTFHHPCANF